VLNVLPIRIAWICRFLLLGLSVGIFAVAFWMYCYWIKTKTDDRKRSWPVYIVWDVVDDDYDKAVLPLPTKNRTSSHSECWFYRSGSISTAEWWVCYRCVGVPQPNVTPMLCDSASDLGMCQTQSTAEDTRGRKSAPVFDPVCLQPLRDERTDRRQESTLVHFSLKVWHLVAIILMIFLDNQLTRFRVFIGWCRILIPPP